MCISWCANYGKYLYEMHGATINLIRVFFIIGRLIFAVF